MREWTWIPGHRNRPSPCMNCEAPVRHENCHAACPAYQEYRARLDAENARKQAAEKSSLGFNAKTNKRGQP